MGASPTRPTAVAMVVMSGAQLLLAVLAAAAAIPLAWTAIRAARRPARRLRWPALLTVAGVLVLVVGGRHFSNGWPGTGGHWWPHQGLVPGGVAAFGWACTLSVTSYWAHPAALASFPRAELAWMVVSPVAVGCVVAGAAGLVRRVEWPARVIRYEAIVGSAAVVAMAAFLSGASCWVILGGTGPRGLFHAGAIDVAGLAVMAGSVAAGGQALHEAYRARRVGPGAAAGP